MTNQVEEKICKYCGQKVIHKMPFGNGLVFICGCGTFIFCDKDGLNENQIKRSGLKD